MKKIKNLKKYIVIAAIFLTVALSVAGSATWLILKEVEASLNALTALDSLTITYTPTNSDGAIYYGETTYTVTGENVTYMIGNTEQTIQGNWYFDLDGDGEVYECSIDQFMATAPLTAVEGKSYYQSKYEGKAQFKLDENTFEGFVFKNAYVVNNVTFTVNMYAVAKIDSIHYATIDGGIKAVTAGDTLNVFPQSTYALETGRAVNAKTIGITATPQSSTYRIPSGATLALQHVDKATYDVTVTDGAKRNATYRKGTEGSFSDASLTNVSKYLKNNVKLAENVTLTVAGTLVVGGVLGNDAIAYSGATTGNYAQIVMQEKSKITSTGTIDCLGYIKKASATTKCEIDATSGSIYCPYVIYDYRGGKYTIVSKNTGKVVPFKQYDCPNIQAPITVNKNANFFGYADLYTGAVSVVITIPAQHNLTTVKLIGSENALINLTGTDAYARLEYTPKDKLDGNWSAYTTKFGTTAMSLYKGASFGYLTLKVSVAGISASVTTDSVHFGVPWNYSISLNDGEYDIDYKMKFMSGSSLTVESDAKLTIDNNVMFYPRSITDASLDTADTFCDDATQDGTTLYFSGNQYPARDLAAFNIKGVVTINAAVGGTAVALSSGAHLYSNTVASITTQEGAGYADSDLAFAALATNQQAEVGEFRVEDTITASLTLIGFGGTSYSSTGDHYSTENNDSFVWYPADFSIKLDANGGTGVPTTFNSLNDANIQPGEGITHDVLPTPTRTYYTINHWCTEPNCSGESCTCPDEFFAYEELYAIWDLNEYKLQYVEMHDNTPYNETPILLQDKFTIEDDISIDLPNLTNPDDTKYLFGGWYGSSVGGTEINSTKEEIASLADRQDPNSKPRVATIYGIFTSDTCKVTLKMGTGSGEDTDNPYKLTDVIIEKAMLKYHPSYDDEVNDEVTKYNTLLDKQYYFVGWYTDPDFQTPFVYGETLPTEGEKGSKTATLYAKWDRKYTLTLNAGSADSNKQDQGIAEDVTYYFIESQFADALSEFDSIYELADDYNTVESVSKYFVGWSIEPSDVNVGLFDSNKTASFDAEWDNKVKLTIDFNNDEFATTDVENEVWLTPGTNTYTIKNNINANDEPRDKTKYFDYWEAEYCSVSGKVVTVADGVTGASITAKWKDKVNLKVVYNYSSKSGVFTDMDVWVKAGTKVEIDNILKVNKNTSLTQYSNGWDDYDTTKCTINGTTVSVFDSITITAKWLDKVKVTVSIETNDRGSLAAQYTYSVRDEKEQVYIDSANPGDNTGAELYVIPKHQVFIDVIQSNGTSDNLKDEQWVTIETATSYTIYNKTGCIASGTLITLADGTQKKAEDITYEDKLLVWDFYTGQYTIASPSVIYNYGNQLWTVTNLHFSDGTVVKMIIEHEFFDVAANSFVYITENNVGEFVGREFLKVDGNGYKAVTLVGYEYTEEYTGSYTILTAVHYNCIAEGMFTLTSTPSYKCETFLRIFEVGENMMFDADKMQAEIDKYGLYTYEDVADYVTYEEYVAFGGAYFKILVGKGYITFEDLLKAFAFYAK